VNHTLLPLATATRCNCGAAVLLTELPTFALPHRWQASCGDCLEPVEDAHPLSLVVGYGESPSEALWNWQDSHDEAWQAGLALTPAGRELTVVVDVWRQADAEARRQAGWFRCVDDTPEGRVVFWAPNRFATARFAPAEMGTGT
jgi:hypothetical protein